MSFNQIYKHSATSTYVAPVPKPKYRQEHANQGWVLLVHFCHPLDQCRAISDSDGAQEKKDRLLSDLWSRERRHTSICSSIFGHTGWTCRRYLWVIRRRVMVSQAGWVSVFRKFNTWSVLFPVTLRSMWTVSLNYVFIDVTWLILQTFTLSRQVLSLCHSGY